ncbi:MAG: cupredoxin domain-containing protein [Chloroflexota bacterium]
MQRLHSPGRSLATATALLVLALAGALLLASIAPATGSGSPQRVLRSKKVKVEIDNFAYHPPTLRIRRGTRVVFANRDKASHTATRRGSFDTGTIRPGHSATVRFNRRGTFKYVCTIHPFMHGKIVVR